MLNPPEGLREESLRAILAQRWNLQVRELEYVPVGFGTHHWSGRDAASLRWFVDDFAITGRAVLETLVTANASESDLGSAGPYTARAVSLIPPLERDLWNFGLGDSARRDLYDLRWDLTEIALYAAQFQRPHTDAGNEQLAWKSLAETVVNLETTAARI